MFKLSPMLSPSKMAAFKSSKQRFWPCSSKLLQAIGQQGQEPQRPDRHERRDLHEEVSQAIPPHLQLVSETSESDRKGILSKYQYSTTCQEQSKTNKLAAPAIKDAATRRWIIDRLPKLQQRAIDITRVTAAAWDLTN